MNLKVRLSSSDIQASVTNFTVNVYIEGEFIVIMQYDYFGTRTTNEEHQFKLFPNHFVIIKYIS